MVYQKKIPLLLFDQVSIHTICGNEEVEPQCYWAPKREEIQRFVEIAKAMHPFGKSFRSPSTSPLISGIRIPSLFSGNGLPVILDVGCGTGFLSYLLAKTEEVNVIAMDPDAELLRSSSYRHPNLHYIPGTAEDSFILFKDASLDMVINSWMPTYEDLGRPIRAMKPKAITYIIEIGGGTGIYDYDAYKRFLEEHPEMKDIPFEEIYSYQAGPDFRQALEWKGPSCSEVGHISTAILRGRRESMVSIVNMNLIVAHVRNDIPFQYLPPITISTCEEYAWERDLEGFSSLKEVKYVNR